jgi:hypothetical protein
LRLGIDAGRTAIDDGVSTQCVVPERTSVGNRPYCRRNAR